MGVKKTTKADRLRMFQKYCKNKRIIGELMAENKEMQNFFNTVALEEGIGEGEGGKVVLTEEGNGIKFVVRKGSVSTVKLENAGVSKDVIDACRGKDSRSISVF